MGRFGLKAEEEVVRTRSKEKNEVEEHEEEKVGFRDRKIMEYENRVRQYSQLLTKPSDTSTYKLD